MYFTDPTLWDTISAHAPIVGWTFLCACVAFCTRLAWKMRGVLDEFVAGQKTDRELAQKTLDTLEAAKKVAMDEVEKAKAHGEAKATELRLKIEENEATLNLMNINHLAHIEKDMCEMNGKQDKVIEILLSVDKNIAILVDRSERK